MDRQFQDGEPITEQQFQILVQEGRDDNALYFLRLTVITFPISLVFTILMPDFWLEPGFDRAYYEAVMYSSVISTAFMGFILCYIVTSQDFVSTNSPLSVPHWITLQTYTRHDVFKLSYFTIVIIPLLLYVVDESASRFPQLAKFHVPLGLKLSYFSAFCFAIATILVTIGCPAIAKLNGSNSENYVPPARAELFSRLSLRWVIWTAYGLGVVTLLLVLFRSAWSVLLA